MSPSMSHGEDIECTTAEMITRSGRGGFETRPYDAFLSPAKGRPRTNHFRVFVPSW